MCDWREGQIQRTSLEIDKCLLCDVSTSALISALLVTTGPPSHSGDAAVYVFDISQPSLPTAFYAVLVSVFVVKAFFKCISFHKFSRQFSALSLYSSGLISAVWVLSTTHLVVKVSFSTDVILCG